MSSAYVYLNTYNDGYLYVGSHVWTGPGGRMDPLYHGSSVVAYRNHLTLKKEEIIEMCPPRILQDREKFWIEKFAKLYGIADIALSCSNFTDWVFKFPQHGKLINLHSNRYGK